MINLNEVNFERFYEWLIRHSKGKRVIQPGDYSQVYPLDIWVKLELSSYIVEEMKKDE